MMEELSLQAEIAKAEESFQGEDVSISQDEIIIIIGGNLCDNLPE